MPYVDSNSRKEYKLLVEIIKTTEIKTKGDLEFLIFTLMKQYMSTREARYSTLHDCTYASQHCADEFRRRYLDKREDEAMNLNGDV